MGSLARYIKYALYGMILIFFTFNFLGIITTMSTYDSSNLKLFIIVTFLMSIFTIGLIYYFYIRPQNPGVKIKLVILVAISLIIRILWIHSVNVVPQSDFEYYHKIASSIISGDIAMKDYIAIFPHVIGFPSILSIFYFIFGANPLVGLYLNAFISCAIVIMVYMITKLVYKKEQTALVAAVLTSIAPSHIMINSLLATEPLFCLLLLISIYTALLITEKELGIKEFYLYAFGLGVLVSISNAIRPFGLIFLVALFLYTIFFLNKKWLVKLSFLFCIIISYFFTTNIISASIENIIDTPIARSPTGYNLYVGGNLTSQGRWNIEDVQFWDEIGAREGMTPQLRHDEIRRFAFERFKNNGLKNNLNLLFEKHKIMWWKNDGAVWYINSGQNKQVPGIMNFQQYSNTYAAICDVFYTIITLLCVFGVILHFRRDSKMDLLQLILIFGFITLHMLVEVQTRYNFASVTLFIIFASVGLEKICSNIFGAVSVKCKVIS